MLVEIYDTSDTKLGTINITGPWKSTSRLDRAGTFSFVIPVGNEKYINLISAKRIVKCYKVLGGTRRLVGAGVIDKNHISLKTQHHNTSGTRGVSAVVSGDDLLRELTNTSVGFLEIESGGEGTTSAPTDIISEAQAGWTLDAVNGYTTTEADVYAKFAGESVLEALVKVADDTGEHFRLGDGRKLVWLRNDTDSSGVKAIQGLSAEVSNENACIITDINIIEQSYDLVTRVYPYGAGNGDARITLATSTASAPDGFTIDRVNNYLQITEPYNTYGLIERHVSFKNIAPIYNTDYNILAASNMLFWAAKRYLDENSLIRKTYSLSVTGLDQVLLPGTTIRVVYRGIVSGNQYLDIDEDLVILETNNEISQSGIMTVGTE